MQGALVPGQESFIKDVVDFIDAPLSPKTLGQLRRRCREHMSPERSRDERSPGVGDWVEVHGLMNTPEFNGLTARVVGLEMDKLLIEFLGAAGQVYDIPPRNLRSCQPPPDAAAFAASPPIPSGGSPASAALLQSRLRCAMSHVEAASEAMEVAQQLHRVDPAALYTTVAEFQPTLSVSNIERNWSRIVQIYQAHAERVAARSGITQKQMALPIAPAPAQPPPTAADQEMLSQLRGVLDFINAPLSPRTLNRIRGMRQQQAGDDL
eukprot:TRINITY_DN20441_c0_g1_i1.p1 TRINITY_DN20441_c0_g1~~TRINITY_DN20441_c0_g1_i1.p1  ORF type:complete len:265 (+),score=94.94 TRINITY_DN20441_c0_g1_i1:54-848(+)